MNISTRKNLLVTSMLCGAVTAGLVSVATPVGAAELMTTSGTTATSDAQNGVTVDNLGLNSTDYFRFRIDKTDTGLDEVDFGQFEEDTDFTADDFETQTKDRKIQTGSKVKVGRSMKLTVVVYDKPQQLFIESFTVSNYKTMKKSCNKTAPQIVVKSAYTPRKVMVRLYKKVDGKTVGKTIKLFRLLREGTSSSYIPNEEDTANYLQKGWKAGKMVTKAVGFKSITCLQ